MLLSKDTSLEIQPYRVSNKVVLSVWRQLLSVVWTVYSANCGTKSLCVSVLISFYDLIAGILWLIRDSYVPSSASDHGPTHMEVRVRLFCETAIDVRDCMWDHQLHRNYHIIITCLPNDDRFISVISNEDIKPGKRAGFICMVCTHRRISVIRSHMNHLR